MEEMATQRDETTREIDLSSDQQWVLHHLMLDRLKEARDERETPPWWAVDAVEKIERGELAFTTFEAWRLRRTLDRYLETEEVPERDAAPTESILETLESTFEAPPSTLQD